MALLRRRVFVVLFCVGVFGILGIHLLLSKDHQQHGHGHTRKKFPRHRTVDEVEEPTEKIVNIRFERLAKDNQHENEFNKNSPQLDIGEEHQNEDEPRYINITSDEMFLNVLAGSPKVKISPTLEENMRLKEQIENLKHEIEVMKKNKKQLQELSKRLIAQQKGQQYFPKLDPAVPWVFAITPTHTRYTQKADLVRLSQTLQHVTNLHWIIVEDSKSSTQVVHNVLLDSGLSFTHLYTKTPVTMQRKRGEKYNKHHRGVPQRNLGLKWIRRNIKPQKTPGVVYFMDDDNTYHKRIFDEMRWTQKVSAWPVALTGAARFQGPIVSKGKVIGFHSNWALDRKFPLDMAAFAVNLKLLVEDYPDIGFDESAKRGHLEPTFLSTITTMNELEPLADNCTKVLVWHTRTDVPKESIRGEKELIRQGKQSDPNIET
ncbi:galactosylgalactosylxylosylprotein 3-beta-glucuronosyltransferase 3-like [Clytia hemisphaerica]|uniref:Galactosylgalactosylxylosylprotein 3-beta-glucuronosyltransferase n=1 Tax=Clytia hemisphaerica TaxID=252671 RepID=A0A7M5WYL4_9CNID